MPNVAALTVPPGIEDFLRMPNPAVMSCLRPDGFPMSVPTWYQWRNGQVVVNILQGRKRLVWIQGNPRVSVTVLDRDDWYRHVSLYGRVVSLAEDVALADMDLMALRYTGQRYAFREQERVSAVIEPAGWHTWDDRASFSHLPR